MIRRPAAAVAALFAAVALGACGEKSEDVAKPPPVQHLSLMLDYFPNADHAGIYAAEASGELKRAGLDLKLRTPPDPSAPLALLAAGKVDVAISYEPELLLARDKGLDLVSIGALVQRPLTSIIALGTSSVKSIDDLEGRTIGTAGIPYQGDYLRTIVERAGDDPEKVKQVDVGFNLVGAMVSGRVSATLGAFWNYEGVELQRRKLNPTIIPVDEAGVPTYNELIFVVRRSTARNRGELLRRLMQALARGHRALRADSAPGIGALLKANKALDARLQRAVVRRTMSAFFPADATKPFGWQEPRRWRAYGSWMYRHDLLKRRPAVERALTNEFLPGQGV